MNADIIVKGIIYNKKRNKFLIVQRSKDDPVGANTWENVGGSVECDEKPEQAIKREIQEEVGIVDIDIDHVAYVTLMNVNKPYLIIAYFCTSVTDDITLSNEHQAYIWANKEECLELLPREIIEDFVTNKIFDYL